MKEAGTPKDQWPKHGHPPKTHAEEVAIRMERYQERKRGMHVAMPPEYADKKVRCTRIRAIRKTIGLTQKEMADVVGVSLNNYSSIEACCQLCSWASLKLAEIELERFIQRKNKREHRRRVALKQNPPPNMPDIAIKGHVLALHVRGLTNEEIATELALRLEVVEYWTALAVHSV